MNTEALRRADFKTSLVLFIISLAMLLGATTFPMTDSYGGVQNAWYLSPALFPMLIASALIIMSVVLFINALRSVGLREGFGLLPGGAHRLAERDWRFLAIVAVICGYVFLFIPHIDFFLATALFLLVFIGGFFTDQPAIMKFTQIAFLVVGIAVWLLSVTGAAQALAGALPFPLDFLIIAAFIGILFRIYRLAGEDMETRRRLRITLIVSLVVPTLLCPAFKYGLLVPLPTEGGVIEIMESIRYGIRSLLQG